MRCKSVTYDKHSKIYMYIEVQCWYPNCQKYKSAFQNKPYITYTLT